ncbi:MAG: extracellular solute-binding protein [Anaerolineae bacterium]|nr:extracellular solute-binding protein [Anaerolineae bacterium]
MCAKNVITRREFLRLAGITTVGAALAACGTQATEAPPTATVAAPAATEATTGAATIEGSPIEIGVMWEDGDWYNIVTEIGAQLEKDYPGAKVTYTFNNTASDAARELRWQAGDPLDVDVFRFVSQARNTWTYVDNDYLTDLTPYMQDVLPTGEKWGDTFTAVLDSFCVDRREGPTKGNVYSIPESYGVMCIQYNKKAFDEMGVEPVKTWPEFLALCDDINEKGAAKGMKPICVSGPTAPYCAHYWDQMCLRLVGKEPVLDFFFGGTSHLRDNPDFLKAAQEIQKLYDNGYFMDGYDGADFTGAQALFFQGKAAMIHMGTWLISEMGDVVPPDFEVGIMPFPTYPGGKGLDTQNFGYTFGWSVPNPAKATSHEVNVPLAIEYLKRFSSKEACQRRAENLSTISATKGVAPPARLADVRPIVENTTDVIFYYWGMHLTQGLNDLWWNAAQALFLGKIQAEEMIQQIDDEMDKYRELQKAGSS